MRLNRPAAVMAVALLTLGASDCSGTGGGASPKGSPSSPAPATQAARIPTNGTCKVVGDLEGKFTRSSQMNDYLACITPGIEEWIDASYTDMPSPEGYYFVPLGVKGKDNACEYDDGTLAYCPPSTRVYVGETAVWNQYTTHGDAASAVIMAHEVTHHFQSVLNFPPATVPHEQIRYENQADCGGGAFASYANKKGWLNVRDDIIDLAGSLAAAGSGPGPKRDHGTAPERLAAFGRAFISSDPNPLRACNRYVPEIPLAG